MWLICFQDRPSQWPPGHAISADPWYSAVSPLLDSFQSQRNSACWLSRNCSVCCLWGLFQDCPCLLCQPGSPHLPPFPLLPLVWLPGGGGGGEGGGRTGQPSLICISHWPVIPPMLFGLVDTISLSPLALLGSLSAVSGPDTSAPYVILTTTQSCKSELISVWALNFSEIPLLHMSFYCLYTSSSHDGLKENVRFFSL